MIKTRHSQSSQLGFFDQQSHPVATAIDAAFDAFKQATRVIIVSPAEHLPATAMQQLLMFIFLLIISASVVTRGEPCASRKYDHDSVVCVCNATYCDSFDSINPSPPNIVQAFVSSRSGLRFERKEIRVTQESESTTNHKFDIEVTINSSERFQNITGFGAAFTDAAGVSTRSLQDSLQDKVISQYWSPKGLRYNLARVVIGGCDFSTRNYTYDDVEEEDFDLEHFSLTQEDHQLKIPLIKKAREMSGEPVLLFGSAWSAPAWMKTNNRLNGRGWLKGDTQGKYYRTWANYYVKFLQAYQKESIDFWGLTTGNEPINGFMSHFAFNCLGFTPASQRDFVKYHLGPALNSSGYGNISLMMLDDQRYLLPYWPKIVLDDAEAAKYISGVALHWYGDKLAPASWLTRLQNQYPDKFILNTEATNMGKPKLGDWARGVAYLKSVLTDLNNWMVGWVEWNFALDLEGGPNWVDNWCDAPIIVNGSSNEFYKQPMYYALAHVTRFVPRGSSRVGVQVKDNSWRFPWKTNVEAGAFLTPATDRVIILLNDYSSDKLALIKETDTGIQYQFTVPAKSFVTFYRDEKK